MTVLTIANINHGRDMTHMIWGLRIIPEVNGAYVSYIFIYYQQNIGHLLTSLMINVN